MSLSGGERVSGVVLVGGASRRMGQSKAWVELAGAAFIVRVIETLRRVCDEILIVANEAAEFESLDAQVVPDVFPGRGSLGGLYSGLNAAKSELSIAVACDMPFLRADVARLVLARAADADVVIPRLGDQLETMHAVYGKRCLPHMEERLRAGRLKIVGFFERVRVLEIPETEVRRVAVP